jgi:hypothetical protein
MRFQTASHQDWNFNLRAAVLTPNLVAAVPLRPQTAFAQGADFRPRAAVLRPQVRRAPCDPDCLCPGCRPPPTIRDPRSQTRRRRARRGPRLPSPQLAGFRQRTGPHAQTRRRRARRGPRLPCPACDLPPTSRAHARKFAAPPETTHCPCPARRLRPASRGPYAQSLRPRHRQIQTTFAFDEISTYESQSSRPSSSLTGRRDLRLLCLGRTSAHEPPSSRPSSPPAPLRTRTAFTRLCLRPRAAVLTANLGAPSPNPQAWPTRIYCSLQFTGFREFYFICFQPLDFLKARPA